MGEHGIWGKHTNFEDAVLTPMLVRIPNQQHAGQHCEELVELIDLYPTLCDLCGIDTPPHVEGTSFRPLLTNPSHPWKPAAFSQYHRTKANATGRSNRTKLYRYTLWRSDKDSTIIGQELYDHVTDPNENVNIANNPNNKDLAVRLKEKLLAGWQSAQPPRYSK